MNLLKSYTWALMPARIDRTWRCKVIDSFLAFTRTLSLRVEMWLWSFISFSPHNSADLLWNMWAVKLICLVHVAAPSQTRCSLRYVANQELWVLGLSLYLTVLSCFSFENDFWINIKQYCVNLGSHLTTISTICEKYGHTKRRVVRLQWPLTTRIL